MAENVTPWQRVFAKFGIPQSRLASAIGRHRSKVSRALKDSRGLISGRDQEALIEAAQSMNVDLTPDDLTPATR